ncbi:hypothetical protein AMELA_G00264250, partial [Ameiurus melas]
WRRLLIIDAEKACSGEVSLQNDTGIYAVSSDGWSKQESNELCKYLECGNVTETTNKKEVKLPFWDRSYSCTGNHTSIWECEKEKAPVENHPLNQLYINCTDKPQVTLTGNCTGEVRLKNERVCYKSQTMGQLFHELCQQLGCSLFFKTWSTKYKGNARYLSCTGKESHLWQCSSWTDNCEEVISLACTKAIKFNFNESCGGKLLVDYQGQWEPVCPLENMINAHRICRKLDCGNATKKSETVIENRSNTDITIKCGNEHNYLENCIETETCTKMAVIYCDNHDTTYTFTHYDHPFTPGTGLIVGLVAGLVLLLVAALIVFRERISFLAKLRFKSSPEGTDVEVSENEMESLNEKDGLERGDSDDIVTTVNPMEDNQSQESESEHDEENMSTSISSSGTEYDDVDERNVKLPEDRRPTEPLLPPRPDNLLDEVTFEAEVELQEDYDDVILPTKQRESFNIPGPSSDLPFAGSNDEVKPQ